MTPSLIPDDTPILFEKLKAGVIAKIKDEQLMRVGHDVEWELFRTFEATYLKLVKMVTARRVEGRIITKREAYGVPAGRLDHFKLAILDERGWLDRWILRHWPVKYNPREVVLYVKVDRWESYPENILVPPEFGEPVYVQTIQEVDSPYD